MGVVVMLLVIGTTLIANGFIASFTLLSLLDISAVVTLAHSACAAKATPIMLNLKSLSGRDTELDRRFDRLDFWHGFTTVFQIPARVLLAFVLTLARCKSFQLPKMNQTGTR